MLDLQPGLHIITKDEYHAGPCDRPELSNSIAKLVWSRSVAHAWSAHPKGGRFSPDDATEAKDSGTLLDSLLLGGDTECVESPFDEYRTKEAKAWKADQLAAGRLPVKAKAFDYAKRAAEAILENLGREGVVFDGVNQLTAIWDEPGGVRCKARLDHWKERELIIYDLKKVHCAHPKAVAKAVIEYGYDIQGAVYPRALETLRPEWAGRVKMFFLFCEIEPPYEVLVRPLAGNARALGRFKWERAVAAWAECLRTKKFPGYTGAENGIEAPPYAMVEMEEALIGGSSGITF